MSNVLPDSEPKTDEIFASIRRMLIQEIDSNDEGSAAGDRRGDEARAGNEIEISNAQPVLRKTPGAPAIRYEPSERAAPERLVASTQPESVREDPNRLISQNTAAASATALSELMGELAPNVGEATLSDDRLLESATRQLLSRLLKAWVDATLPSLVESIVRDEIRSVVRAAKGPIMTRN